MQPIEVLGRRFVLVEEAEYERLLMLTGKTIPEQDLPPLPKPDRNGNYPAVEYARASIARDLIRERHLLALTQTRFAELAGVRQETLSRLESGKHSIQPRTLDKIATALERERRRLETRGSHGRGRLSRSRRRKA